MYQVLTIYELFQRVGSHFSDCGNPPAPQNGNVTLTVVGETTFGATASQSCRIGFYLASWDKTELYCQADGLGRTYRDASS